MGLQVRPMGFDTSTTVLHYFNSVSSGSGSSALVITSGGRNSTSCLSGTINTGTTQPSTWATKTLPTNLTTGYVAFAFKFTAVPTNGEIVFFWLLDGTSTQIDFRLQTDGRVNITRAGTTIATTTYIFSASVFYHAEVRFVINDSTGSVDWKINGVSSLSAPFSGDTKNTSNAYVTAFQIGCYLNGGNITNASTWTFDDVVVRDDAYSGDCRVREQLATGTGNTDNGVATGASTTLLATDDTAPNSDTDYSSLVNVSDKFLLTFPAIPTTDTVLGVALSEFSKKSAAGPATYKSLFRISTTEYNGATEKAPSADSYAYFTDLSIISPATGVTYTATEVNGMQVGVIKIS